MEVQLKNDLVKRFKSKLSSQMLRNRDSCSRCGLCTEACQAYASIPLVKCTPSYRAEVVRRIDKHHFTPQGAFMPVMGEAKKITNAALIELKEAAFSCTGCRRCMVCCPFGIDTRQIMPIAKRLFVAAQAGPETLSMLADMSVSKGQEAQMIETWRD